MGVDSFAMSEFSAGILIPGPAYWRELVRPWKLFTFGVAMALLLYGAVTFKIADWDVGITLIMGPLTYVTAPWCVATLMDAVRYRSSGWLFRVVAALAIAWFVVDGVYWLYHTAVGNLMFREDNWVLSSIIYFMAGLFWLFRGTLKEFAANLARLTERK